MNELLQMCDGLTVQLRDRPAQGTRHDVVFGVVVETGKPVAVKFERIPGTLGRERSALACLGASDGPVPRLPASGSAILGDERVECVVSERRPGSPPANADGWRRMGRAHAVLAERRDLPAELPAFDRATFGQMHARRIRDLGGLLAPRVASIPDWRNLASAEVPGSPPQVITHGDPGPGNFLDDGRGGSVVDWEEAQIAPRGLDLARLVLIALLGSGPSGYVARDHDRRARAVSEGYFRVLRDDWRPSQAEWRWWTAVAGIQFAYRRWQLGGKPAPWEEAVDVLLTALADDRRWPGT